MTGLGASLIPDTGCTPEWEMVDQIHPVEESHAPPTVAIALSAYDFLGGDTALVTFTFSQIPVDFSLSIITVSNGVLSLLGVTGNPLIYTALLTINTGVNDLTNVITVGTGWKNAIGIHPLAVSVSANYTVSFAFVFDPTALPDGALPSPWTGPTWDIVAGEVVNTPVLGVQQFSDPGLESAYVAGLCDSLGQGGAPTVAQSADVHGGAKAQQFTGTALADRISAAVAALANRWYALSVWGKRTAGGAGNVGSFAFQVAGVDLNLSSIHDQGIYKQALMSIWSANTNNIFYYLAYEFGLGPFDTVIVDDLGINLLSTPELIASVEVGKTDVTVKARWAPATAPQMLRGTIARLDDQANPQNYLLAYMVQYRSTGWVYVGLAEVVAGTLSKLIDTTYVAAVHVVANDVEIRCNGATVSLWYAGVQVGADQITSILTGTKHGVFGTGGGNSLHRFYCGENQVMTIGWAGSSNTQSPIGYRPIAQQDLIDNHPQYNYAFLNISVSGWATFPNLVNKADLAAADLIIFDQSNDGADDTAEVEALIRKASAAGQRVLGIVNPAWSAMTDDQINVPANAAAILQHRTVLGTYGVPYVDGWALIQAHVAGGGHITDWFADTAHYNATGYAAIAAALDAYLPLMGTIPTPLPTRIYPASEDFENVPVIKNGVAYDARTGVWTDTGTRVESADVGATITYSGTFRKFGVYNALAVYPNVTVTIDGGAPIAGFALYPNGYDLGVRGLHTVVITVTTTVRIDEFWAI